MNEYWINIREDGTVTRSGMYTPKGAKIVSRTAKTITFKIPGHSYWRTLGGPRGYAGVEYVMVEPIDGSPTSTDHARVRVVARYSAAEYKTVKAAA